MYKAESRKGQMQSVLTLCQPLSGYFLLFIKKPSQIPGIVRSTDEPGKEHISRCCKSSITSQWRDWQRGNTFIIIKETKLPRSFVLWRRCGFLFFITTIWHQKKKITNYQYIISSHTKITFSSSLFWCEVELLLLSSCKLILLLNYTNTYLNYLTFRLI